MIIILCNLLLFSFCCSLVCVAINNALAGEEMILSGLGDWLDLHAPFWLCKMLFSCLPCMATIYGSIAWLGSALLFPSLIRETMLVTVLLTPAIVLMVSGFNILAAAFVEMCKFYSLGNGEN